MEDGIPAMGQFLREEETAGGGPVRLAAQLLAEAAFEMRRHGVWRQVRSFIL